MRKHPQKRYFRFGCAVTLLLAAALMVWLFSNTNQVPTSSFASTNALLVLQGPLNPHDEGVKDLWEHTLSSLRREEEWLEKVLRWLGMPLEMTVSILPIGNLRPLASLLSTSRRVTGFSGYHSASLGSTTRVHITSPTLQGLLSACMEGH
jgi:hypothetical protein